MAERAIPNFSYGIPTKDKILEAAVKLFAVNGYNAVSMRDIADAVGIAQGSSYNHYKGKEEILEAVMLSFEQKYKCYFEWLVSENAKAETLEEVMDNMFAELLKVRDLSVYYGISLLMKEQFNSEPARKRLFKLIYEDSINWIQADFDRLMAKGVIPQGDSKTAASILMWCVLAGNDMRINESMGVKLPIDCTRMYAGLKVFLTTALRAGTLPAPGVCD